MNLSFLTSFAAGFITFFTPCVLPLIPVYISMVTGLSVEELRESTDRKAILEISLKLLLFILGFTIVFTLLGATGAAFGRFLIRYRFTFLRISGVLMILFGLYLLGLFKAGFLSSTKRLNTAGLKRGSFASALLFGMVFGFAWSPCTGPILASILILASSTANVHKGALYLFGFSMGIGIPLFLSGILFAYFLKALTKFKRFLVLIDRVAGILIILIGLIFVSGYHHILF